MKVMVCSVCNGTGEEDCNHCTGTGSVSGGECPICKGTQVESCSGCWGSGDLEEIYGDDDESERKPKRPDGWG
jgi:hypothetical protein